MTAISLANTTIEIKNLPVAGSLGISDEIILNANSGLFGESDAIEFQQEAEQWMKKVGVRGEKEWGRTGEKGGEVKIRTMATSILGDRLRSVFEDQRDGDSATEAPSTNIKLTLTDNTNRQTWTCTGGLLIKGPVGPKAGTNGYEASIWTLEFEEIEFTKGSAFVGAVA